MWSIDPVLSVKSAEQGSINKGVPNSQRAARTSFEHRSVLANDTKDDTTIVEYKEAEAGKE